MAAYHWPGNVRELVNTLDGMLAITGSESTLYTKHLPLHIRLQVVCETLEEGKAGTQPLKKADALPSFKVFREKAEINYLRDLMDLSGANISKACEISGISRSRLYEMLAKYGLTNRG
jgi:two-component system NtrC family response regulator